MFGQQKPLFGTTPTNLFGQTPQSTASTNMFGQALTQPVTPFGQTNIFGSQPQQTSFQQPSTFSFGTQSSTNVAQPSTSNLFGFAPQAPQPSLGLFGTTAMNSLSEQQPLGTPLKYKATTTQDSMFKNGTSQNITAAIQCISAMKEYENKSLEELRLEDYVANRKFPQQQVQSAFTTFGTQSGTTNLFGAPQPLFGATTTTTTSLFGQPTASTSLFGTPQPAPSLFGQPQRTNSLFGQPTAPASLAFGATPATGLFGAGSTASKFMLGSAPATTTTGFSFNFGGATTTTAPAPSLFGASQQQSSGFPLFGGAAASTGTSSSSLFGQLNAATSKPSTGLFGFPSSSVGVATPFGAPQPAGGGFNFTSPLNQPAPTGGTTNLFGQQPSGTTTSFLFGQQTSANTNLVKPFSFATPASSTGFNLFGASTAQQPTTNLFGMNQATSNTTGFTFPGASTAAPLNLFGAAPTAGGFSFGATTTTSAPFGSGFSFGAPASAPSVGLFGMPTAATTTSTNIFGFPTAGTATTTASAVTGFPGFNFGANAPAPQPTTNLFGQQTVTQQPFGGLGLFGATPSQPASLFPTAVQPPGQIGQPFGSSLFASQPQQQAFPAGLQPSAPPSQLATFDSPQNAILRKQILDLVNLMPYGDIPMIPGITVGIGNKATDQVDSSAPALNQSLIQQQQLSALYGKSASLAHSYMANLDHNKFDGHRLGGMASPKRFFGSGHGPLFGGDSASTFDAYENRIRTRSLLASSFRNDLSDTNIKCSNRPRLEEMFLPRQRVKKEQFSDSDEPPLPLTPYEKSQILQRQAMARTNDKSYEENYRLLSRRSNIKELNINKADFLASSDDIRRSTLLKNGLRRPYLRSEAASDSYNDLALNKATSTHLFDRLNKSRSPPFNKEEEALLSDDDESYAFVPRFEGERVARRSSVPLHPQYGTYDESNFISEDEQDNDEMINSGDRGRHSYVQHASKNGYRSGESSFVELVDSAPHNREANVDGDDVRMDAGQVSVNTSLSEKLPVRPRSPYHDLSIAGISPKRSPGINISPNYLKKMSHIEQRIQRPLFKCTKEGYYTEPSEEECYQLLLDGLKSLPGGPEEIDRFLETRELVVKDFTIGRKGFGDVHFTGLTNILGLDIDRDVFIDVKDVSVYPNDEDKPPIGEGLNKPAIITLHNTWPIDKSSMSPIKELKRIYEMRYETKLIKACKKMGVEFLEYIPETGTWIFEVSNF